MSISVHRAMLTAAGAAVLAGSPAPALAQVDRNIVLNILVECAKIDDATARLACYDNNIRNAGGTVAAAVPGRSAMPQGGGAPLASGGVAGFGRENVRSSQQRFQVPAGQVEKITPAVSAVAERGPGVYLITLEDGAQWLFAEDVAPNFRAPRPGATVEIERGSLGSFLLRYDDQRPVQVRRIR
jgi:hypothetical protein